MKRTLIAAALALAAVPALVIAAEPTAAPKPPRGPDANNDGYLSRSEVQAAAEARFKRLDANGDGKLEKGEGRRGGPPPRADGPGGPMPRAEGGPPPRPEAGRGEWRGGHMMRGMHGMRGPGGPGGGFAASVFDEYDANKDGALSLAEFRAHAVRVFEAQDGNRDGKIKLPEHPRRGPDQDNMRGKDKPGG